jgi:acyl-CoA dehydrogenase
MSSLVERLSHVAREVIAPNASVVDREARFPDESVAELRRMALLAYGLPAGLAGAEFRFTDLCRVAAVLGESCLSTAIIWAMHCQQVVALTAATFEGRDQLLRELAERQPLVASITTELGKGGDFLRAQSPLARQADAVLVDRYAPIVSYGQQAEYFLITMKGGESDTSTCLVLASRSDGLIEPRGGWDALGMRGTQSIPMQLRIRVRPERVIREFPALAAQHMVPIAHLGWSAAWFGAARGLYFRVIRQLRQGATQGKRNLDSELLRARLAEIRALLDTVEALLTSCASQLQGLRDAGAELASYRDVTLNLLLNNVKVTASRNCQAVASELMELCGLFDGYLASAATGIERVFRDLRAATLMFKNERLLDANGRLSLVEQPRVATALFELRKEQLAHDEIG